MSYIKILIIGGAPLENGAGIERFVRLLINQKEMADIHFTFVFPYFKENDYVRINEETNLNLFPIKVPFSLERKITKTFNSLIFNLVLVLHYTFELRKDCNVVHINGVNGSFLSLFARRKSLIPIP